MSTGFRTVLWEQGVLGGSEHLCKDEGVLFNGIYDCIFFRWQMRERMMKVLNPSTTDVFSVYMTIVVELCSRRFYLKYRTLYTVHSTNNKEQKGSCTRGLTKCCTPLKSLKTHSLKTNLNK